MTELKPVLDYTSLYSSSNNPASPEVTSDDHQMNVTHPNVLAALNPAPSHGNPPALLPISSLTPSNRHLANAAAANHITPLSPSANHITPLISPQHMTSLNPAHNMTSLGPPPPSANHMTALSPSTNHMSMFQEHMMLRQEQDNMYAPSPPKAVPVMTSELHSETETAVHALKIEK